MQFRVRSLNCGCKNRHLELKYHMFLRLIVAIVFSFLIEVAQGDALMKAQADSLFENQKYTEAFQLYETIYKSDQFTESMLLKMAFIKDGLGDYTQALYYLDTYYKYSADKAVVTKIEEISDEKQLSGYKYNDSHFFKALLNKYESQLQLSFLAIAVFLTAYIYRKRTQKETPITAALFQVFSLAVLFLLSNKNYEETFGIIITNNTLLRSGPSAGAEAIDFISKGHKVQILERSEVWTKISWDGDEVFLRNGKIQII